MDYIRFGNSTYACLIQSVFVVLTKTILHHDIQKILRARDCFLFSDVMGLCVHCDTKHE